MTALDDRGWNAAPTFRGALGAIGFLALAASLTAISVGYLPQPTGLFLFFAAVLLSAARFGFWIGLASALAAFATFNFLFVEPYYTFRITDPGDLVALAEFLLVAGLTGFLAGRLREEANAAKSRASVLEALSDFATDLAEAGGLDDILRDLPRHLAALAKGPAVVLQVDDDQLRLVSSHPAKIVLDSAELQAADRAYRRGHVQEGSVPGWQGSRFTFVPLRQEGRTVLVLGHQGLNRRRADLVYREQAIEVICQQTNLAIERNRLAQQAERARITADRESLRSALLTSLSHDLRTPLATILGAITSLRELGQSLTADARDDLQIAIEEEAQRLSRYVDNLLQMTRLQSGLTPRLAWVAPDDVVAAAVGRAQRAFPGVEITVDLPDLPMIRAEAGLLEQALFNLIDNAVKFSEKPARVEIKGSAQEAELTLSVIDHGQGIPAASLDQIFTPFFRANPLATGGTGLGLTICQGLVQALGGSLRAQSPVFGQRGTAMHINLPVPERVAS